MNPVSWDGYAINDGNFLAGLMGGFLSLPDVMADSQLRSDAWPLVANVLRPGRVLFVQISVKATPSATYRKLLHQYFDPEDETAKQLVIEDDDGTIDRYVYAVCERFYEAGDSIGAGVEYVAELRVHGDVRWRETTPTTDTVALTATGQTKVLTNNGADDAYPIITIKPTSANPTYYAYKQQLFVRWRVESTYAGYPTDVTGDRKS